MLGAGEGDVVDGDVGRTCGDEVDGFGDVLGGEGVKVVVNLGFLFVSIESYFRKFGLLYVGGGDLADSNIMRVEVYPHGFGEGFYGVFGGTIDVAVGIDFLAGYGTDIDDVPGLAGYHLWCDEACDVEESFDIGVYHGLPMVEAAFVDGVHAFGESCVIEEDVNVFPFIGEFGDCFLGFFFLSNIEIEKPAFGVEFFFEFNFLLVESVESSTGEYELIAVLGE